VTSVTRAWRRAFLLGVAAPLLLTACGRVTESHQKLQDPGPSCQTQGTVDVGPSPTIPEAVSSFRQVGEEVHISQRLPGAATVQLRSSQGHEVKAVVTLVRTKQGWAPTSVARC